MFSSIALGQIAYAGWGKLLLIWHDISRGLKPNSGMTERWLQNQCKLITDSSPYGSEDGLATSFQ